MRRAARSDDNQSRIVRELRKAGLSVLVLSRVGRGAPDLLVGHGGRDWKFEVKNGAGRLTAAQLREHASWKGAPVRVVRTVEEIFEVINKI